jgi:beta-lactamase class A
MDKLTGSSQFSKLLGAARYSFFYQPLDDAAASSHCADVVVSSASTIKLFVMAEVFRQAKEGRLQLSDRVAIPADCMVDFSMVKLLDGANSYTLLDLVKLMIVQSDNTATNFLIDRVGMESVNLLVAKLGLNATKLQRKMLDFEAKAAGYDNLTSANDLGSFLRMLCNGKVVDSYYDGLMVDVMKHQLDRSMAYAYIPDDVVVAHKTGDLDGCNHDAGIAFTSNGSFVFAVMVWDADSNNQSRSIAAKLIAEMYACQMLRTV